MEFLHHTQHLLSLLEKQFSDFIWQLLKEIAITYIIKWIFDESEKKPDPKVSED
jgi:hypothetical protein